MNIKLDNVTKVFNDFPVVQDLSFTVEKGKILGLLGPNGAGKTTTLRMILDILQPDDGTITFGEKKISRKIRNQIGYLPEERGIYQKYKVVDVLVYFGRLKNMAKRKSHVEAVRMLDRFEMVEYLEQPVSHLSKGLQQKLQLLITLIHDPEILILDEPFWGLDPFNQQITREKILALRNQGKVILLSTHQLSEAEALCDYFVLVSHGKAVVQGTLDRIRQNFQENIILVESQEDLSVLREIPDIQKVRVENSRASVYINENAPANEIMKNIIQKVPIQRIELKKPTLNDIFLQTLKGDKQGGL